MIRLFKGNCIYIEQAQFVRNQILEKYRSPKMHQQTKFIIMNQNRIITVLDYRDILLKRSFMNNIRRHSQYIFEEARQYLGTIDNLYTGCPIGVIKTDGSLDYILEYWSNNRFVEKERQQYFYAFTDYNYPINFEDEKIKNFLSSTQCFVFEHMEEYTIHMIQVLLTLNYRGANYRLYSLDERVGTFFAPNEVAWIADLSVAEREATYCMVITEKYSDSLYKDTGKRTCYKSLEIMTKFYEAPVAEKLKCKTDRPFVILEDEYDRNGLVDLMKHNMTECELQEIQGKIPVINLYKNGTYGEFSGENVWEYYFKPVTPYSLDQVYASGNYTVLSRELFSMAAAQQQEYQRMNKALSHIELLGRIQWKNEILEYCKSELPHEFLDRKKILGVIARGTDWNIGISTNTNTDIDKMIYLTKQELGRYPYDRIYLATEDYDNYSRYQKEFGELVISSAQERFKMNEQEMYTGKWIAQMQRGNDGFEYGLDYMVVIYCLSQCDSLLASMSSGAYIAAVAMNHNKYKRVIIVTMI